MINQRELEIVDLSLAQPTSTYQLVFQIVDEWSVKSNRFCAFALLLLMSTRVWAGLLDSF